MADTVGIVWQPVPEITGFHKGPMGFQIDLENGWTVSVQFGIGNYCSNRSNEGNPFTDIPEYLECPNAEIAAWPTNSRGWSKGTSTKEWYTFEGGDQVAGYKSPNAVLAFMNMIANRPPHISEPEKVEGLGVPKPCYVCDEEVLATDKECYKYIAGGYKYRHLWHGVPGITRAVGGGGGFNGYAQTLEQAKGRAEYYLHNNPYAAPEVKQGEQEILDEVNRLMQGGEYLSECCDATPLGELDSGTPFAGTEYYRVGFCSKCKDNAVFIKEVMA